MGPGTLVYETPRWARRRLCVEQTWRTAGLVTCHSGLPSGSVVENLPAAWKTWVPSLGREDPLGKGTATHSSILAWRIPWTEEPAGVAKSLAGS